LRDIVRACLQAFGERVAPEALDGVCEQALLRVLGHGPTLRDFGTYVRFRTQLNR
jgi:hypothetical protein